MVLIMILLLFAERVDLACTDANRFT